MMQTNKVVIADKTLVCDHCGSEQFLVRSARMNVLSTFIDVAWLNLTCLYVCSGCGKIHWFLPQAGIESEVMAVSDESYPFECLQCGNVIEAGQSVCTQCGWTYKRDA